MAGIAIVLDLWRKNPSFCSPQTVHSSGFLSAAAAAASAASAAAAAPFASRFLFGSDLVVLGWFDVVLVMGFGIFEVKAFAMTSVRSFLMYYLPLLEPNMNTEEDDDDFLQESQEEHHVDLVVPFKKSVKQIVRETTVVTTRRILERLAVHYVSQRTAWKLLKDAPKSAMRKAERGLPTFVYFVRVSRTTLKGQIPLVVDLSNTRFPNNLYMLKTGHFLGVAASWIVQIGIEVYRSISRIVKSGEESDKVKSQEAKLLGKKFSGVTIRCGASLVFASIGAGIGATIIRPSVGQWIGCAVGDLAGPIIVTFCLDKALHVDL
ncbi:hypothetical protein Patl1_03968 [Pistacia atlantica]|uniref:Uncharacterized protein n=1 Tax=Pistacia atlantica TaxID=434234 RepID=A0ACC1BRI5_9ROSI|nr:hypothetical protein Patl1_03968 [Pistacia atlantica]